MSLDAWTPLETLDDDLLTLESAALLSLTARHRIDELNAAIAAWGAVQRSVRGEANVAREVATAIAVLTEMLQVTGLELPSAVKMDRLTSFNETLREMSSVVVEQQHDAYGVRAAMGLLNLACEASMERSQVVSEIFCSGLLDKAWRDIGRFVDSLDCKPSEIQPPELRTPASNEWNAHDKALLGDYTPWTWGIGPMFQTLGGWDSVWLMSAGVSEDEHWDRIRYWTPLPHLALGPLGWSDPAIGAARWILMGMPETTPELSLLAQVWGSNALMYFSHPQMDWVPQSEEILGFQPRTTGRRISHIFQAPESARAFSGCGELHIQIHLQWQMCGQESQEVFRDPACIKSAGSRKAFLELDAMTGWHRQLRIAGDKTADELGEPRLEITVIAPPVGNLGTFKRSRLTGLWYSGSHEAHILGHSKLNGPIRRLPSTGVPATTTLVAEKLSVRHTNAAAFWIASELTRRHPHYVLAGDIANGLRLASASGPTIHISRRATVEVGEMELLDAADMFAADDKRQLVEEVEATLGLPARKHAAATTERTVMYRAMAHLMAVTVSDKATWDFVAADPITDGAWHWTRDGKPLALLMPDGTARLPQGSVNLLERYRAHSRRMTPMIGEVFGAVLP